jgi:membrane-associated PAP2 superfamily phosphatase
LKEFNKVKSDIPSSRVFIDRVFIFIAGIYAAMSSIIKGTHFIHHLLKSMSIEEDTANSG